MTDDTTTEQTDTDWKAESERLQSELQKARKWEDRAKANASAAQRLAELESASKTDLEKALERAEKAETRSAELETEVTGFRTRDQVQAWKTEVAEATKVPAQYLRGATKEELQAHAEELAPVFENRGPVVHDPGRIPINAPGNDRETARRLFNSATTT